MEKRPNLYALTGSMFYFLSKDCSEHTPAADNEKNQKNIEQPPHQKIDTYPQQTNR